MNRLKEMIAVILAVVMALPGGIFAANHRSGPINALDQKAGFTDVYAFVSYGEGDPTNVTLIITLDPFLEPGNGPTWFPFDPEVLYEIKVDNNHDAVEDIVFQFRFQTEQRLPGLFQAYAGFGDSGAFAPANSAAPVPPGTLIVPPRIDDFDDIGLGQRQSYTIHMFKDGVATPLLNNDGSPFFVVPANVGPRTMDYEALFSAGTYELPDGVSVFAGTTDDAFWLDLGATFDTLNLRTLGSGIPAVLTDAEDAATENFAPDEFSGYAVNAIAIEVPIEMLTCTGLIHPSSDPEATIGVWGATSRPRATIRRQLEGPATLISIFNGPAPAIIGFFQRSQRFVQIQRMANPLINELFIGIGSKDRFSMDQPKNDSQFSAFFDDPALPRIINALTGG